MNATLEIIRSLVFGSDLGFLVLSDDGSLIEANAAAEQLFSHDGEQMRTFAKTVIRHRAEESLIDVNGLRLEVRRAGIGQGVTAFTLQKQKHVTVAANELKFGEVFNAVSIGMALVDANTHTFLEVNGAFCSIVNRAYEQLVGKCADEFLEPADPAHAPSAEQRGSLYEFSFESRHVGSNGKPSWARTTVSTVPDASGAPKFKLVMLADTTEKKELAEQLNKAQRMETIGQLAGGIAHDFNNLLMIMNGYAQVLVERLGEDSPLGKKARMIENAGLKAANLTAQLLAFSRRQVLHPKVIDVDSLIANFEAMIGRIIGEDVRLKVNLDSSAARVLIDPSQLEQVLMNLVVNARDAMPKGGDLTVTTSVCALSSEEVAKRAPMKPGNFVRIAVADTGTGMAPEVRNRIFEPFFTTKEVGKGTGLGLPMVYGIVRQSRGSIWVETEPGAGTTVEIYLPVESAAAVEEPRRADEAERGSGKVLLVEDEREVREMLEEMLTDLGYEVITAANADDALGAVERERDLQVLVTDSVMPGMGGRELAQLVRSVRPDLRVLLISGYAAKKFDDEVIQDPAIRFLQKPFSLAMLSQVVRSLVGGDAEATRDRAAAAVPFLRR